MHTLDDYRATRVAGRCCPTIFVVEWTESKPADCRAADCQKNVAVVESSIRNGKHCQYVRSDVSRPTCLHNRWRLMSWKSRRPDSIEKFVKRPASVDNRTMCTQLKNGSLNGLKNFAGAESSVDVAVGVVNFHDSAVGREMANACLEDLREHFRGDTWGNNGPGVITRVLQARCKVKKAADFRTSAASLSWGVCCQPVVLGRVDPGFVLRVEWITVSLLESKTLLTERDITSSPVASMLTISLSGDTDVHGEFSSDQRM
uniref:Alpha 1,4-glycosyltransferase domain-containing protein n=1 Tax=Timema cristinae TaxID=61476 RepID=A0A7R9DAP2_TIMCR|nr:unnamed protein product [Timema cristinae]